jgi:hypothetical protein
MPIRARGPSSVESKVRSDMAWLRGSWLPIAQESQKNHRCFLSLRPRKTLEAHCGPLVESLAQQLALAGMPIQVGWIVERSSIAEFRIHPVYYGPEVPLTTVQSSLLNAEPIFRGSQIQDSLALALPRRTVTPEFNPDIETHLEAAVNQSSAQRTVGGTRTLVQSSRPRGGSRRRRNSPKCRTTFQIPDFRDRLIGDISGLDLPVEHLLFGESDTAPDWDRIDTAERPLRRFTLTLLEVAAARVHTSSQICPHTGRKVPLTLDNTEWVGGCRSHTPALTRRIVRRPQIRQRRSR